MTINTRAVLVMNRAFGAAMAGAGQGVLINLGSLTSFRPSGQPAYAMGKAAIRMMTEVLAAELGPQGRARQRGGARLRADARHAGAHRQRPAQPGADDRARRRSAGWCSRPRWRRRSSFSAPMPPQPSPGSPCRSTAAGSSRAPTPPTRRCPELRPVGECGADHVDHAGSAGGDVVVLGHNVAERCSRLSGIRRRNARR